MRLSTLEVLCVGSGQTLQRGTRAVEDLRDAAVELFDFFDFFIVICCFANFFLQKRDKLSSETVRHSAKVRATRAVFLPGLLGRTILTILCSIMRRLEHRIRSRVQLCMLRRFTRMFVRVLASVSNAPPITLASDRRR